MTHAQLRYDATDEVARAIAALGRTEDVAISPGRNRLALAAFNSDQLAFFDIAIAPSDSAPAIVLADHAIVSSTALARPHGVAFIDDDTVVVASRQGSVSIFAVPRLGEARKSHDAAPLATLEDRFLRRIEMPGSVFVAPESPNVYQALVCNNYSNRITRHRIRTGARPTIGGYKTLVAKGLATPDGIALSSDGQWIAVSNHITHEVFLYDSRRWLGRWSAPDVRLEGMDYPHGLRFTKGGAFLLVADAGAPLLHVFEADGPPWSAARKPVRSLELLDEETFQRGRHNPLEGGIKGIDIDDEAGVLVTTCQERPLAFYDLKHLLG